MTQPTQASEAILRIQKLGDIEGKIIGDLGAGTGMLGLTALICGAKKVYFFEIDDDAIVDL